MSEAIDTTALQFISNATVFVLTEAVTSIAHLVINEIINRDKITKYKMFKWDDGSKCESSTNTTVLKSIGDKWKSIIGHMDDEPLLDDENLPEEKLYESSPEADRFQSLDNTLLETTPKWRCVSDESFLRMEEMVRSPVKTPLKRITENEREVDVSTLIAFSPYGDRKDSRVKSDVESSTADYETCESGDSRITDVRKISLMSYITCDSGESRITDVQKISWTSEAPHNTYDEVLTLTSEDASDVNRDSHSTKHSSNISPGHSEVDESLKFNDTLEEMEHLLKYGMNYMVAKDDEEKIEETKKNNETKPSFDKYFSDENNVDFNKAYTSSRFGSDTCSSKESLNINTDQISLPKYNVEKYRDHKEINIRSPANKKTSVKKIQKESNMNNKENKFRLRSPRLVMPSSTATSSNYLPKPPSFQQPKKTPTKPRKFFYDTPPKATTTPKITPSKSTTTLRSTPLQSTPINHTPSKYTNIMSPIQYYIKNSPVVPKIQNVSPGVNLWERQSHRAPSRGRTVDSPKENVTPLKEIAYQQPRTTKMIEVDEHRLPKSFKVGLLTDNLPKPVVIKHQHREGTMPLKENNVLLRQNTYTMRNENRESFADLDPVRAEVSVCIEKPAVRTHTLK